MSREDRINQLRNEGRARTHVRLRQRNAFLSRLSATRLNNNTCKAHYMQHEFKTVTGKLNFSNEKYYFLSTWKMNDRRVIHESNHRDEHNLHVLPKTMQFSFLMHTCGVAQSSCSPEDNAIFVSVAYMWSGTIFMFTRFQCHIPFRCLHVEWRNHRVLSNLCHIQILFHCRYVFGTTGCRGATVLALEASSDELNRILDSIVC